MSEREFRHWRAKFALEPDAVERLDWWMGQVLPALVNPYLKRGREPLRADKLIPDPWGERAAAGAGKRAVFRGQELADMIRAWAGG